MMKSTILLCIPNFYRRKHNMKSKKDTKGRNLKSGEDQLKSGRYRYRYTDCTGKRIAIYSWRLVKTDKNPSEKRKSALSLREMIKNIEKDKDDGILTYEAQTITVYQLIRRYLKSKVTLANSTLQNYIHLTEKNIRPHNLGQMKVSNVKKSDIKNFFSYLYTERHFAVSTIQLYQNIFSLPFKWL